MEKIALYKYGEFYLNNHFLFETSVLRKWFVKDKYQIIDAFGKVQLFFYFKNGLRFSEILFVENNLSFSYEFVQKKNSFYWIYNGHKYYIKQPFSFSYKIEFYRDNELIGSSLKNSFWKSYFDQISFSFLNFITDEEIELYLILYAIHYAYFGIGD
ncbi:MAG: hypothetical protein RSF68_09725 [Myroides sp.]